MAPARTARQTHTFRRHDIMPGFHTTASVCRRHRCQLFVARLCYGDLGSLFSQLGGENTTHDVCAHKDGQLHCSGFIIMRFISVTLIFHVQAPLWSKLNKDLYMRTNKKTGFLHYSGRPKPKTVARVRCVVARWSHTCPNQDPSLYIINLCYSRCLKLTILNIVHNLLFYVNYNLHYKYYISS